MITYATDRPDYQKPAYHPGMTPPFPPAADTPRAAPVNVEAAYRPALKAPPTPYDNAYTRDSDGALMIELAGWGTFVSETWAVAMGYISPSQSAQAKMARDAARKARKDDAKEGKKEAFRRKQKRIQKAREKEMLG